ncbi:T9SS type A sorting domain-containing protein, partial [Crocinitomix catalasitica]|nr:T9SS type A sorting domain-containing protein [Crocinitomix catalasitica]
LDGNGKFVWAAQMGGTDLDQAKAISIDASGNIFVSGNYRGSGDYDPSSGTTTLISGGLWDVFAVKLDTDGSYIWSESIGGSSTDKLAAMNVDVQGSVLLAGFFQSTVDFDFTAASMYLSSNGSYDAFVQKLDQCLSTSSEIYVTECSNYVSPSGAYTWTESGIYTDVVLNTGGCDSLITINLTIEEINAAVSIADFTLTSEQSGVNYQWVDCNADYAPIVGATEQSFTPGSDGNYAVIVTTDICTDTSECYEIKGLSIANNEFSIEVKFYPNPAIDVINIQFSREVNKVSVIDVRGHVLTSVDYPSNKTQFDVGSYPAGIYFFAVETDAGVVRKKFMVGS